MKKHFSIYFNLVSIVCIDILLTGMSWYGAFLLRFNFNIPDFHFNMAVKVLPTVILTKIIIFYFFNLYRGMWRFTSIIDLFNIIKASVSSTFIIIFFIIFVHDLRGFSRSVFIIDNVLTILFVSGFRICIRLYFETKSEGGLNGGLAYRLWGVKKNRKDGVNLLIIGAGNTGEKIFREILDNGNLKYNVVGFLDDNQAKQRKRIHGVPVMGTIAELSSVAERFDAHEILIAVPSATSDQMRTIIKHCKSSGLSFKTLPGIGELIDGRVSVSAIREVAYRDLLGREIVYMDEDRIDKYIAGKRVLVTGAGGSIGSELCRQICRFNPDTLILFDQAESSLYGIDLELRNNFSQINIVSVLGDIRNRNRLVNTFDIHRPNNVFHAAAYKHVPMLEAHPREAVLNNIAGTKNVIDMAERFKVERFVLVSTDKAVRPANVMGATKRIAELMVQEHNCRNRTGPRFITVRFGNVVGSVGSVVPLFKKQIKHGGPVTITHPDVTRYFMTIPEASQLILQAGVMGKGGEIFILKMGKPIKIADMANDLIRFSGLEPDKDIKIEYIGLRPGEKLYEELITKGEDIVPTEHGKIMVLNGQTCFQEKLNSKIDRLIEIAQARNEDQNGEEIKRMLRQIVPEYAPCCNKN